MNKQDYGQLAKYLAFDADENKPELIYTAARGLFAPADEPAEVSIRHLRDAAELLADDDDIPAQMIEHRRVLELERALTAAQQRIETLEAALRWYGEPAHYARGGSYFYSLVELDSGKTAREALTAGASHE